jgi:hypothetical protein
MCPKEWPSPSFRLPIKVKLSLCLTNWALHHEGIWGGSGCIGPHFPGLGTSWRWVVSFTRLLLYPRGKSPGTHWIGGWVGPRASLVYVEKRKFLNLLGLRLQLQPLGHPARGQSLYQLHYPSFTSNQNNAETPLQFLSYLYLCTNTDLNM